MPNAFARYELRALQPGAARAFYAGVLGEPDGLEFSELPERARALGAVPHWLGQVSVPDVEAAAVAWVEAGAQRLGPTRRSADGFEIVALKDAFGSVIGLTSREAHLGAVAWHELSTMDQERAFLAYSARFGWQRAGSFELDSTLGLYQEFSYAEGGPVGGMLSGVRLPGIHPHWLYYFAVSDLDASTAEAVARGARVVPMRFPLPEAGRFVVCEDPEGAIFALREVLK
jgi:predicted enzyme related to lactoylglutathione lyase